LDHPGKHPLGHPQGLPESLCFFGLYGIYLAVVLLPARLRRNDGAQQEDVELEDRGLISERWGKDGEKMSILGISVLGIWVCLIYFEFLHKLSTGGSSFFLLKWLVGW